MISEQKNYIPNTVSEQRKYISNTVSEQNKYISSTVSEQKNTNPQQAAPDVMFPDMFPEQKKYI